MRKIVAFSGTYIKNGNIEKALKAILAATEAETELVRLADLDLKQCRGCIACGKTNRCIIDDGVNELLEKIIESDGFIFSAFPSFGSVNALTKTFMERNWPLRHNFVLTKGKVTATVVGGVSPFQSNLDDYFKMYFNDYLYTDYQGALVVDGVVPCTVCGFGENCEVSGFKRRFGQDAKISPDKFYDFDQDNTARELALKLGKSIKLALNRKLDSNC